MAPHRFCRPGVFATLVLSVAACSGGGSDTVSPAPSVSPAPVTDVSNSAPAASPPATDAPVSTDAATTSTASAIADEPTQFTEGPCPTQPPDLPVACGTVSVPLNHDDPQGASILLVVAILHAADDTASKAPVFFLGGGPGENTVGPVLKALSAQSPFLQLSANRDVVFVEQRGSGLSQPTLDCPEYVKALAAVTSPAGVHDAAVAGVTAC
ncbi:MAG: alpha/beta fold hydrolase, partial [Ilumatobacteraceae bacterium]|nr:alpha/beta fold hydrolase [Ilumatobacteraceae bacterium]